MVFMVSPQNCVFYRTEIHGTGLKQPLRIEYLIKQKPRGTLVEKQLSQKGRIEGIEEVGSCHLLLLQVSFGNLNGSKLPLVGPSCRAKQ